VLCHKKSVAIIGMGWTFDAVGWHKSERTCRAWERMVANRTTGRLRVAEQELIRLQGLVDKESSLKALEDRLGDRE